MIQSSSRAMLTGGFCSNWNLKHWHDVVDQEQRREYSVIDYIWLWRGCREGKIWVLSKASSEPLFYRIPIVCLCFQAEQCPCGRDTCNDILPFEAIENVCLVFDIFIGSICMWRINGSTCRLKPMLHNWSTFQDVEHAYYIADRNMIHSSAAVVLNLGSGGPCLVHTIFFY